MHDLVGDVDLENKQAEEVMGQYQINGETDMEDDSNDNSNDNVEGWIDEMMLLSPTECEQVEEDI